MQESFIAAPPECPPRLDELQRDAAAQLALVELFPHLRQDADAAMRDLFVSLRLCREAA